ncbi:MAG: DUF3565 domain-containing protein [Cocleimonas sp.]|nr:DUF3565 domain-containing protein [Cocleimonas sp.]
MKQPICAYHQDKFKDWVAELVCGHYQHIRHNPPWIERPWVMTQSGRVAKLGHCLECKKCNEGVSRDWG